MQRLSHALPASSTPHRPVDSHPHPPLSSLSNGRFRDQENEFSYTIKKAPCPQTIIHWVMRLSIVRIEAARSLKGLPLRQAPFTNGLIWLLDLSIGLGTGKILAVLACDAQVPSPHARCPLAGPCPLYWVVYL